MIYGKGLTRRAILKGSAGAAALATIGAPAIVGAQSDVIRVGHLTPAPASSARSGSTP